MGSNQIDQAIPMVYLNDDYWVLHVTLDTIQKEKITYHYFILNEDGSLSPIDFDTSEYDPNTNFNKILTSNDVVFYKDNKPKPIKQLKYLYQP